MKVSHTISWKYMAIILIIAGIFAIANNLRAPQEKRVSWIGSQPVMAKPEGAL